MRYDLCIKCSRTVLQKQLCQINQTLRMLLLINLFSFLIKIRWTNILGNRFFRDNQFSLFLFDGLKLIYWICHNLIKNKHEEFIVQKKDECSLFLWYFSFTYSIDLVGVEVGKQYMHSIYTKRVFTILQDSTVLAKHLYHHFYHYSGL